MLIKKIVTALVNWKREWDADCEDHRLNHTNYGKKYWYVWLLWSCLCASIILIPALTKKKNTEEENK